MLRRYVPFETHHLYVSNSETESDDLREILIVKNRNKVMRGIYVGKRRCRSKNKRRSAADGEICANAKTYKRELENMRGKVEKYQESMKKMKIPSIDVRAKAASFTNWQSLAKWMIETYKQPLHYLTHKLLEQWDEPNVEKKEAHHCISDPSKAQDTIWIVEEYHRKSSSHLYIAKLWLSDPMHSYFLNSI